LEARKDAYIKNRGVRPIRRKQGIDLPVPRGIRTRTSYGRMDSLEEQRKMAVLVAKMAVSAVIIVVVMLLKSIDIPATRWVVDRVKDAITYDFNISDSLGKLKFVSDYLPGLKSVFSEQVVHEIEGEEDSSEVYQPVFAAPAEGKVVGFFGQGYDKQGKKATNQGIDILSQQQGWVYSVADGKVIAVGEDETYGKHVKIEHSDGWVTLYGGCEDIQVQVGESVKQGDKIGKMGKDLSGGYRLHFETLKGGQPLDPLQLIQEESKVLQ
jgi:murein DD-endopeptidase MepM/ murein hydrolase activator NlpD